MSAPQPALLLHGPLESVGLNLVSQYLHPDPTDREHVFGRFHCEQNIIALARVFRAQGFKVAYSGWQEDCAWLEKNSGIFDALAISDQSSLKSQDVRGENIYPNNKEKLYYSVHQGLEALRPHCSEDGAIFRLRSDAMVHPQLALAEMARVVNDPGVMLIEYFRPQKMLSFPDFMLMARLGVMNELYEGMYSRSRGGQAYHLSSHVDHSLSCIGLQQQGRLSSIQSMGPEICASLVWRGIPRYLQPYFDHPAEERAFNTSLAPDAAFDIDRIVANVPPELSGRPRAAQVD